MVILGGSVSAHMLRLRFAVAGSRAWFRFPDGVNCVGVAADVAALVCRGQGSRRVVFRSFVVASAPAGITALACWDLMWRYRLCVPHRAEPYSS